MSSKSTKTHEDHLANHYHTQRVVSSTHQLTQLKPASSIIGVTSSVLKAHEAALSRYSSGKKLHNNSVIDPTVIVPQRVPYAESKKDENDQEQYVLVDMENTESVGL